MKKVFTLLLLIFTVFFQNLNAQTNPSLVTNFKIDNDLRSGCRLSWSVANNEAVNNFGLEKSVDGKTFTTIAVLQASKKTGVESYTFSETTANSGKTLYRLKILNKGFDIYYSKIILFQAKPSTEKSVMIMGNPVKDKLTFSYNADAHQPVVVTIYNMDGKFVINQKISSIEGNNLTTIPLSSTFNTGMYVMKINNGADIQTATFLKQ